MEYNSEQQTIINCDEPNILVNACFGSGKTTTLVGSIQRYEKLHPNDHITAITFTKKAAESLAERINDRKVEISTIHSWAYRRLQQIGNKYGFRISLLEENVIKDILKQLCLKRRQYYINQFQLYSFVMGNYNIDVDEKIKHTLNLLRKDYINYKEQNKLYDFTDLPKYLYDMCIEYQYIITDTDALFVDEFQDIDPVQLDVFDIVAARKRMYIGDYKQAIYGFRGACVGIFDKLIAKGGWTVFDLKINYRSKQEIADYATSLYKETVGYAKRGSVFNADIEDIIYKHEIDCERKFGGTVVRIGETEDDCYIFDTSEYYWEKGDALHAVKTFLESNVQILCRSNKQVKKIQSMGWQNVSTVHQAKGLEYDSVILVNNYGDNIEELNILYVGITRAKNMLCIIDYDMLLYCLANCQNLKKSNVLF